MFDLMADRILKHFFGNRRRPDRALARQEERQKGPPAGSEDMEAEPPMRNLPGNTTARGEQSLIGDQPRKGTH